MDYKTRIEASIQEHLDAYMDIVKTLYDNDGILTMSIYDFLLNEHSLEL